MESDIAPMSPAMPRSAPFEPGGLAPSVSASGSVAVVDRADRNGVFGHLVHDDTDIAGLVAYSIYKQHKLDWLRAFEAVKGRGPTDDELASYIIGEGTPRRLATYRHLAEATLAGNGPELDGTPGVRPRASVAGRRYGGGLGTGIAAGSIALYALIALLFVVGFYLAMHFTATNR